VTLRHPWAIVGSVRRVQGWKLHISSIQTEAADVLRRIVPTLKAARAPFKVIRDDTLLGHLNEGALGATQIGKFATIYPPSDTAARRLAGELVEALRGFHGPTVATDLRLGDVVYARYGGFDPIVIRDRLGRHASYIRDRQGRLRPDHYAVPFSPPPGRPNPFSGLRGTGRSRARPQGKLLGPGFLLLEMLKAHPKGAVFRALDLRRRDSIAIWIVKQGRPWCCSDGQGRDTRARLRHQARVHAALRGRVPIPDVGEYFEEDETGYLPVQHLRGRTFLQVVGDNLRTRPLGALRPARRRAMLVHLIETIAAVERMHAAGYVHRDLNGENVLVGHDGGVYLLDLELSHAIDDDSPAFGLGTLGFMSPEQAARRPPRRTDDVYSLGALTLLMLTGVDPRRLAVAAPADCVEAWNALAGEVDRRLVELAARCLDRRPARRPALADMRRIVARCLASLDTQTHPPGPRPVSCPGPDHQRTIRHGLQGLVRHTLVDRRSGLWLSGELEGHEAGGQDGIRRHEVRRSANKGVAGVLYVLGRLARHGHRTRSADVMARRAAAWLVNTRTAPDAGMPGLHFGEAGVAVGLVEAIAGGLVARTPQTETFIRRALSGVLDWPDLTHGAAGQGVAALYCGDRLDAPEISALSARCARYLVDAQRSDGAWAWPPSVTGRSGELLTGFAHGVAGIVYFLADYARRYGDRSAGRAWVRGADWLIRRAQRIGDALWWPVSNTEPERWKWWCHGSIGIALLFLRLYEQTGDRRYADTAQRALRVHPSEFLAPNLSQCHGMSGVGEAYLEASRVLGDRQWRLRAERVLHVLRNLQRSPCAGAAVWLVEDPTLPTADLMVGGAGVVHLFLRASVPMAPIGPPLLLDPLVAPRGSAGRARSPS
jgi:class IV lanthipeptide synthase